MRQNYSVYPAMIDGQAGIVWSYDNSQVTSTFDSTHPVNVSTNNCDESHICVWYVSPVWQFDDVLRTNYTLLGELDKWTAVSRQRFLSITTNTEKTQTTVVVQGVASETVQVGVYHSSLGSTKVNCSISTANGQANLVITPTSVTCS